MTLTPPTPVKTLNERCTAVMRANAELLDAMLQDYSMANKLPLIEELLKGGGSVGIETLVDGRAKTKIMFIGIEREGARLVLGEIKTPENSGVH